MSPLWMTAEVLQWLLIPGLVVLNIGLLSVVTDLQRRTPDPGVLVPNLGLPDGSEAPAIDGLEARSGKRVSLADHIGEPVLLVLVSPSCGPCMRLAPEIKRYSEANTSVPIIVISLGAEGEGYDYAPVLPERVSLLRDADQSLRTAYGAERVPLAYVIDAEGKIGMRAVPNTLLDLEDAMAGYGNPQGNMPWLPLENEAVADGTSANGTSANGASKTGRD
ncbi:MAG: TlpA disulfide reductase family protein [Anaerolineae bacterium]